MDISAANPSVVIVEDLEVIPGRHTIHCEPDFCGRMNVVLGDRTADRVTFRCKSRLVVGQAYTLSGGDSQPFRARITRSDNDRFAATVIEES